jgi:hydroxyacylglutathione hydrolase
MRISKDIYLVASGVQGCSITDDFDCNCYAFDSGEGLVLFDSGAGRDVDAIFNTLRQDGLAPEHLTHVFLTHGHADHSGGAAEIVREKSCKLLCGALTVQALERGEEGINLVAARNAGVYPRDYVYTQPKPDRAIEPGMTLTAGRLKITPVATPGHSRDHIAYLVESSGMTSLVSGDALFHSGRIIYQATDDFNIRQSCETIEEISRHRFDALLPGHGMFVLSGAQRHLQVALCAIQAMKPPSAVDFADI